MGDDASPEPAGWGDVGALAVTAFRLVFLFPYHGLVASVGLALSGRERLAAHGYAHRLEELGEPFPDPVPSVEEMRRRFLARLPDPDRRVRDPDAFAAEGWLVLGSRVTCLATLAVAAAVLAVAAFAAWRYGQPWAAARVAAHPWSGVPLVAAATAGAWALAGWLAAGAFALTATVGPVRWFSEWAVTRANRALWNGDPPPESPRESDAPGVNRAEPVSRSGSDSK